MRRAASIAALGAGKFDGEGALLSYGDSRARLRWHQSAGKWLGEPQVALRLRDLDPMAHNDDPVDSGQWRYFVKPLTSGLKAYGWNPQAIRDAAAAYGAGLVLQENLTASWWSWSPGSLYRMAVVYYNFDNGDTIGPAISPNDTSPGRNVGTPLNGLATLRRYSSTGWVNCPIDTPTKAALAPHLYTQYVSGTQSGNARVEYVLARWRWAGTP